MTPAPDEEKTPVSAEVRSQRLGKRGGSIQTAARGKKNSKREPEVKGKES